MAKVMVHKTLCIISDGRQEKVMFDKITSRIQKLCYGLNSDFVDPVSISFIDILYKYDIVKFIIDYWEQLYCSNLKKKHILYHANFYVFFVF